VGVTVGEPPFASAITAPIRTTTSPAAAPIIHGRTRRRCGGAVYEGGGAIGTGGAGAAGISGRGAATVAPPASATRAAAIRSVHDRNRSCGRFPMPVATTASSDVGRPGRDADGRGGGSVTWATSVAVSTSDGNGTRPVSVSNSTDASAYSSVHGPIAPPWICSGAA
jgi:hypothetical protein